MMLSVQFDFGLVHTITYAIAVSTNFETITKACHFSVASRSITVFERKKKVKIKI